MIVETYLVLAQHATTGNVTVSRVTRKYPALAANEAVLELQLEVPDDVFDAPLFTVEVGKQHLEVGVEPQEVEQ